VFSIAVIGGIIYYYGGGGGGFNVAVGADLECKNNLTNLRQDLAKARMTSVGHRYPESLSGLALSDPSETRCPVSGRVYLYDHETGVVRCTTPGHENY
jgi:hypothetical protein